MCLGLVHLHCMGNHCLRFFFGLFHPFWNLFRGVISYLLSLGSGTNIQIPHEHLTLPDSIHCHFKARVSNFLIVNYQAFMFIIDSVGLPRPSPMAF